MKKLFTGIGLFLSVLVFAIAFKLLPPHIQIRGVKPDIPGKAELESFLEIDNGPTKISYIVTASQNLGNQVFGYTTFAIEWGDGKILLIDLGMDEQTAIAFGEGLEKAYGAGPVTSHGSLPDFLGEKLHNVEGVAFTHLHSDHVQGIEPICAANTNTIQSIHTIDQMRMHNFNTRKPFEILQNSTCLEQLELASDVHFLEKFPGIGVFPVGGHTPGSTLFVVPVDDVLWLLSGDITNTKTDMLENNRKGLVYSFIFVPENEARLETLRLWFSELDKFPEINVIVSHDTMALTDSGMPEWQQP